MCAGLDSLSHFIPWCMSPYSREPQWSQNVGLEYVCTLNLCLLRGSYDTKTHHFLSKYLISKPQVTTIMQKQTQMQSQCNVWLKYIGHIGLKCIVKLSIDKNKIINNHYMYICVCKAFVRFFFLHSNLYMN